MNEKYKCNLCNKHFKQKCHYDYHINRKRPCIKNNFFNDIINNRKKTITPKIHYIAPSCTKMTHLCAKFYIN